MNGARLTCALALLAAGTLCATHVRARDADRKRWAVGLEAAWLGLPHGHLGLAPSLDTSAICPQLVARYRLLEFAALDVGVGLPHSAMGLAGSAAFEVFATAVANQRRTLVLELYQKSGVQLGYAGPDYFARHDDEFVGYGYAGAGPLAFALRFPVGVNVRWAGGTLDTYTEAVPIITFTPASEVLYTLATGVRLRF